MQRLSVTLALALAAAAPSWADTPASTPAPANAAPSATAPATGTAAAHHKDMLVEKLQLKPDQTQKFKDIMDEKRQRRRAIMGESKDMTQKQSELDALHDEIHQKLAAVLTPEQLAHYEQLQRNRPHRGHGPGKPGAKAPSTPPATGAANPAAPTAPAPPSAPKQN